MRFAWVVFTIAGIWGVLVLTPLYFLFDTVGRRDPPAVTHPEFYYGFVAAAMAWQVAFFVIARNPLRFRPVMIPAVLEKLVYVASVRILWMQGRLASRQLLFGGADLLLGLLFLAAFVRMGRSRLGLDQREQ